MKFNYSLQSVLDYKKQIEDFKKEDFADANNRLNKENDVLDNISHTHQKAMESLRHKKQFEIQEQKHYAQYMINLESKIQEQKNKVNHCEQQRDEARIKLESAQKERKIMESLEEKELEQFIKEIKLKEEKELNEIATIGFARNKKGIST